PEMTYPNAAGVELSRAVSHVKLLVTAPSSASALIALPAPTLPSTLPVGPRLFASGGSQQPPTAMATEGPTWPLLVTLFPRTVGSSAETAIPVPATESTTLFDTTTELGSARDTAMPPPPAPEMCTPSTCTDLV